METTTKISTHKTGPFETVSQAQHANLDAGQFYFSDDTVKFFSSRSDKKIQAGRVLVESVKRFDGVRLYGVLVFLNNGIVRRAENLEGDFLAFSTNQEAQKVAEILADAFENSDNLKAVKNPPKDWDHIVINDEYRLFPWNSLEETIEELS